MGRKLLEYTPEVYIDVGMLSAIDTIVRYLPIYVWPIIIENTSVYDRNTYDIWEHEVEERME